MVFMDHKHLRLSSPSVPQQNQNSKGNNQRSSRFDLLTFGCLAAWVFWNQLTAVHGLGNSAPGGRPGCYRRALTSEQVSHAWRQDQHLHLKLGHQLLVLLTSQSIHPNPDAAPRLLPSR